MELEIGLKITQTRPDLTSIADLRIVKDKCGFIFTSKETETAFILTAHLKGYRRHHIDIAINEDGSQMVIHGSIPVQEKVMRGWIMHKKEVQHNEFQKVFLIPKGVLLDNVKAKFEEDKSTLTIFMPKSVKGLSGQKIEEIKETREDDANQGKHPKDYASVTESNGGYQLEQSVERERTRSDPEKQLQSDREQAHQTDGINKKLEKEKEGEKPNTIDETLDKSEEKKKLRKRETPEFPPTSIPMEPYHEVQNEVWEFQESKSKLQHETLVGNIHGNQSTQFEGFADSPSSKPTADGNKLLLDLREGDESHDQGQQGKSTENVSPDQFPQHVEDDNNNAKPSRKRRNKCNKCNPAIVGSALLVSLLIIVTQLIRTKRK